jgi:hypothetical protein
MKIIYWKIRLWSKRLVIWIGLGPSLIEFCKRCGRKQPLVWHAPDELWLAVTGQTAGVFCPECFDALAREKGMAVVWRVLFEYSFTPKKCSLSRQKS